MMEVTDSDLLEQFQQSESDEAFARIVDRYINLVYSVALRHTANPHHAEEITQAVFIILARRAGSLGRQTVLSGWLHHAARLTAANFLRSEIRRARREQEAFMRSTLEETPQGTLWQELSPLLDNAMARLKQTDRDALVLRYFENKSLPDVGKALGVGERAAQKRVGRALEKLRRFFAKRGVAATVAIIATEISSHSIQAAPMGLAQQITATAAKGSAVAGTTLTLVKGTVKLMTWLKAKTAIILGSVTVLAAGASVAITHHNRAASEQERAQAIQNKLEAERAGGAVNVSQDPNAQKLEAEQKERQQRERQQKALDEQQAQPRKQ
jgi:RNA polymerase sigma factor (sigma-70 family)